MLDKELKNLNKFASDVIFPEKLKNFQQKNTLECSLHFIY